MPAGIIVKLSKQTRSNAAKAKRWGVIFTCLSTRALHLELSGDMSTDSFILSLRRFIARRGQVLTIRSDNGTNLVGADNELKLCIKNLNQNQIQHYLCQRNIEWIFNPPASPWMGGVWESLIRSVKRALKVIIRDRLFTEESLYTFICEVESLLNSRPLTAISDDINDYNALTPNHILLCYKPEIQYPTNIADGEIYLRKKWRAVQAAVNMFWARWIKEYLPSLTVRKKWTNKSRNIQKGDIVLIVTDNMPRNHWPLGRIIETFPGIDGIIRSVKVKTPNNEYIRPVSKLCVLEMSQ